MGFLIGALIFLVAKWLLPAIVVKIIIVVLIGISIFSIIGAALDWRQEDSFLEALGAAIFIVILIVLWNWV